MEIPPRGPNSHLVGPKLMIIAYLTIGIFETFAAFFAFIWVFYEYGFTLPSLYGAGPNYRTPWNELVAERKVFFVSMCRNNVLYSSLPGKNCDEDFRSFRLQVLAEAQAAFFLAVVWGQVANVLVRKTQVESIFSFKRMFLNKVLLFSIVFEIFFVIIVVFVPGLNSAFLLSGPSTIASTCALWIIPFLLLWEETRKYICRLHPDGWFSKNSNF